MGKRWSREIDQLLLDGAGVFSINWFMRKTGRTKKSLDARTRKLYGSGGLSRGTHSLRNACLETGYSKEQLLRAQRALDQKWKRLSPRGKFLITFEQLQAMLDWLQHDYWYAGLRLYGCVNCGSRTGPAKGMGLCSKDYRKVRRACHRLNLPSSCSKLLQLTTTLDSPTRELRALVERLSKGWGPTVDQLTELAKRVS